MGLPISGKVSSRDDCEEIGVEVMTITTIVENRAGGASRELELGSGSNSIVKAGPLLTAELFLIV